jgi:hypothetical protein
MMKRLGLREEDMDDVVFEEEEKQPVEAIRWMAVAKVHTEVEFSHYWFKKKYAISMGSSEGSQN